MASTKTAAEFLPTLETVLAGRNLTGFDKTFLTYEIERAIGEINRCRRFTPKQNVLYDIKYEYLIIPMCVASLAKIGAEGQMSHVENGITRMYGVGGDYPTELTRQIIPLVK